MTRASRVLLAVLAAGLLAAGAAADDKKPQTIPDWGTVTDPEGDCTIKADGQKLRITIPEGTHDLNQKIGGMKAPRVLQEVAGDFTVQVKVTGDFNPGDKAAAENASPFVSGGLLVWQDEKNYLRVERNAWWIAAAGKTGCFPPLVEYYRDGEYQETNPDGTLDDFFKGRSTWLRIERRGEKATVSYSHDGKEWTVVKEITTGFPDKVQVGVAAINTAAKPLTVEFEEFKLTKK
jgi:regulation of enolase protein 1 (concanavalin A-like superfamily)